MTIVSSTPLMRSWLSAPRASVVGVPGDGVAGGLALGRAAPGHAVDERRSSPRRGRRRPAAASRRAASRRASARPCCRAGRAAAPRSAPAAASSRGCGRCAAARPPSGGRSPGGVVAVDITAPFPGGGAPGRQPADCPAGTPSGPPCHVHGSVRRRETATSTRPDRSRCSTSAATGSQGHSEAKCATSQSAGPLDSMPFRDRVVLEVAGQEDVGARGGRGPGQRPAAAAADGDPAHDPLGIAGGPDAADRRGQGRGGPRRELAERHRRGQVARPGRARPAGRRPPAPAARRRAAPGRRPARR